MGDMDASNFSIFLSPVTEIPLLVDEKIIGELWEDVEPRELEVGAYWHGK